MDNNSLKVKFFKDFILEKNHAATYITQAFPMPKRTLTDILTLNSKDDDEEIMLFNYSQRQLRSKIVGFVKLTVPNMSNWDFKAHFRLTRNSVEFLILHLGPLLVNSVNKSSLEKQCLIFIWYMANCETHRQIGNRFNVSESTSHGIIINCLKKMQSLASTFIRWPTGQDALNTVNQFNNLRALSFPNVFGAIDGCHFSILAPWEKRSVMKKLNKNMFYNRKQVPSILLQGIVNADQMFIDIFAGWPGSSHDARMFRRSTIGQTILDHPESIIPPNCHILGDGAYPLAKGIMVPYKDNGHLTLAQKHFNKTLSSSRVVIEQAFGKLIGRFRKLKHMDVYHKSYCTMIITAACCLHNICIVSNDDFDAEPCVSDGEVNGNLYEGGTESGITKRDEICSLLFIN